MVDDTPRRSPEAKVDRVGYETITAASPHPMVVVTAALDDGTPAGCLVGFHTACSVEPVRHLVCIATVNHTFDVIRVAEHLTVHRLSTDHESLARHFGEHTSHATDKFTNVRWHLGPHGTPLLDDVTSRWTGRIVDTMRLGDHWGFVVEPVASTLGDDLDVPVYTSADAVELEPGHPLG